MRKLSAGLILLLFAACVSGAELRISELPTTNATSPQSLLMVSALTGGGGYTSRAMTISNLVNTALSNLAVSIVIPELKTTNLHIYPSGGGHPAAEAFASTAPQWLYTVVRQGGVGGGADDVALLGVDSSGAGALELRNVSEVPYAYLAYNTTNYLLPPLVVGASTIAAGTKFKVEGNTLLNGNLTVSGGLTNTGIAYIVGGLGVGAYNGTAGGITLNRPGGDPFILIQEDSTSIGQIRGDTNLNVIGVAGTGGIFQFVVNPASGHTGIFTNNPQAKLHVHGHSIIASNQTVGGNLTVSGGLTNTGLASFVGRTVLSNNAVATAAAIEVHTTVMNNSVTNGAYIVNRGTGTGTGASLRLGYGTGDANTAGISGYASSGGLSLGFLTGANQVGVFDATGKFGVKTNTPALELSVHGSGILASNLYVGTNASGTVTVGRDPTAALEVATKQYADSVSGTGVTNASILYVQTNGFALGTAIRGNPNKPYNTITAAVAQAQSGDTIRVGAGKHYVINAAVELPPNVSLVGEGMKATEIIGNAQLIVDGLGPIVNPGDNSYIGHLSILATNEATFSGCIGVTVASPRTFTNVVVDSVFMFGNTDNIYVDTNALAEMTVMNSYLFATYDNVFLDGGASAASPFTNSLIHLQNCKIYGTNLVNLGNNGDHVRNINVYNGRVVLDNCSLCAQGGTFWSANIYTADADARVWVNNTSFRGSTSGGFYSITNAAGNVWIQSSSVAASDAFGPGTTTWDEGTLTFASVRTNVFGHFIPIGPSGLTNVTMGGRWKHILVQNETLTFNSSTNIYGSAQIRLYTDGSAKTVTWDTNNITSDSEPWTNNFVFTGATLLNIQSVSNKIHIDWSGSAVVDTSITNGLASIDYANSLVRGVSAVSSNCFTEAFGGTLANWETEDAAGGFAISSGKLRIEHSSFSVNPCLRYTNWYTMSHGWTFEADVTPLSTNAADSIGFGIRSYKPTSDRNLAFRLIFGLTQPGRITALSGTSNLVEATKSETNLWCGATIGDTYKVRMQRRGQDFSMFVSNMTAAAHPITKHRWSCTLTNGIRIEPFMGYPTIWGFSGTQEVDNVSFSVDFLYPVNFLCVGDSITTGIGSFSSTTNDVRVRDAWPQQLRERMNDPTIQSYSCGSVGMYNIGLVDRELALFAPSNILCNFGVTDTGFGIDAYKSNYIRFDSNALVNILRGGKVYKLWPSPQDSTNLHQYWEFLMTNWPSENLDCVTFAKDEGNEYTLRERFDTGDGIHPNREFLGTFSGIVERFLRGQ